MPADTLEMGFVNGFLYTRLRPLIAPDRPAAKLPPRPVLKLATRLQAGWTDIPRHLLECLVLEAYRDAIVTTREVQEILGLADRLAVFAFPRLLRRLLLLLLQLRQLRDRLLQTLLLLLGGTLLRRRLLGRQSRRVCRIVQLPPQFRHVRLRLPFRFGAVTLTKRPSWS